MISKGEKDGESKDRITTTGRKSKIISVKYSIIKKFSGRNLLKIFEKIKEDTGGNGILLGYEEKVIGGERIYEIVVGVPDMGSENTGRDGRRAQAGDGKEKQLVISEERISSLSEILQKLEELKREFASVKENVEFISKRAMSPAEMKLPQSALTFFKKLVTRGVERSLALSMTEDMMNLKLPLDARGVSSILSRYMLFRNPLEDSKKKFIALVGPTGVGKTTTAAKISALYMLSRSKNVALLETDRYRIASVDQIKKYAEIMGVPLFVATTTDELKAILPKLFRFDLVVIDTMGKSQYDVKNIKKISSIISALSSHMNVEVALLISTSQKDEEIVSVIRGFSEIGIDYFIFTKVDETSYPGTILNIGCTTEIPLAFVTTGQSVPDDIKLASPDVISDLILGPPPITRYLLKA